MMIAKKNYQCARPVRAASVAAVVIISATTAAPIARATLATEETISPYVQSCVKTFQAAGKTDLLDALLHSTHHWTVVAGDESETDVDPGYGGQTPGVGSGGTIFWKYTGDEYPGEGDPCTALYHEMAHASDFSRGTDNPGLCYWLQDEVEHSGPTQIDEVLATRKENEFRAVDDINHQGSEQPRTEYGEGFPLPPDGVDCDSQLPGVEGVHGGSPVGATSGTTNGDPHMRTFDGVRYDLQAVGEFTVVKSTIDNLEIQGRQVPFENSTTASVNTAVAMNVNGDRVGIYDRPNGQIDIHVNGSAATASTAVKALPKGGIVAAFAAGSSSSSTGYTVTWPDNTTVTVTPISLWGFRMDINLADARRGHIVGLLGNVDGNDKNDFTTRDNTPVTGNPPTFHDLYQIFGNSWRIRQADSLFDYAPGENTDTFTDRSFPSRSVTAADLPNGAFAAAVCKAKGLTDPTSVQDCALDYGISGDPAFIDSALAVQTSLSAPSTTGLPAGPRIDLHANPKGPTKVAVAPDGRHVYVEQWAQGFMTVVDAVTNTTIGNPIALNNSSGVGSFVTVSPDGHRVYSTGTTGVSVVDTSANAVLGNPIGLDSWGGVVGITITPDGRRLYVTGEIDPDVGRVWVVDSATSKPISIPIPVGSTPAGIAIGPDGRRGYVANLNSNTISVIDTTSNTVVGNPIGVGRQPDAVKVSSDGRRVYVAHLTDQRISVIDTATNTVIASPDVPDFATDLAISPDSQRVYVLNTIDDPRDIHSEITTIDTTANAVIGNAIKIPGASGIAISPDGHRIYVSDNNGGLTAMNTGR